MHAVRDLTQAKPVVQSQLRGFCAGSTLLTMDGELPVEHLAAGDRVITRDCGMSVLRDVAVVEAHVAPIIIKPGSFGHTRPDRETVVLPDTRILIRDWRAPALYGRKDALVAARQLVDGEFVATGKSGRMRIFTLTFDKPHILYLDGLEVCSE